MTHVSKNYIDKELYRQIINDLYWILANIKTEDSMKLFLNDFFTKTEKLMLAKRLMIALMISKQYDTKSITQLLKVSTATVYRLSSWVEQGGKGLHMALNKLIKQEKMEIFWNKIDRILEDYFFKPTILPRIPKDI